MLYRHFDRNDWWPYEPRDPATSRGGGIFLHVRGQGNTAGCIAMSRDQLRWLLRWARPGAHPWIAMGPRDYLVRL